MKKQQQTKIVLTILLFSVLFSFAQELPKVSITKVGLDSVLVYKKVDSIMKLGIKNTAFPGAQLLVAKDSKIIFHKAYGYHTYDSLQKVQLTDIYDVASVTKITAALPALMKLYDEGKIDLDVPFSTYWKPWRHKANKKHIILREILAHQAGLAPYIVFLNDVLKKNGKLKHRFVKNKPSKKFSREAYNGLYVKDRFKYKMYRKISRSKVSKEKKYKYSGLTFLLYPELVKQITGLDYNTYLQQNFYTPLGLNTMGFLPKNKKYANTIVPTEIDTVFRKELTRNFVHDENAALLGGISGNAALFASATDLAKIMQMYLNYGVYNGKRYFSNATVKEFTRVQYPENNNKRGLGFDKPTLGNDTLPLAKAYPAPEVSKESFGHAGFTGTFVWADPKNNMVFIFLSNRVYPTRTNRNLYTLNIRPALQQVFYTSKKGTN
ncbi:MULTISPECIES: serine hydrolase domain-containing protein [unclassified Cellulophaga]|uniref:serine hydrolase domain-containing protein n=1 Tax=unclassified Cellulophaga TaxID=2634405 RepID=UPI0026E468FF|nr:MULTISPECIES: serine hydrolase [unclassified Cellulophaga]MDO6489938.1 serine hydrolase [Cellulophaga sp. 2_MG-2023]MDO6494868.1 serine hydrolase [Cellulophaga sp. 3_MG-2023]